MPRRIYDTIHRFIHLSDIEERLIDSPPFQRLHQIRQLGIAYLVYPGATHTRFAHSLGVMHLASAMFDRITLHHTPPQDLGYWRQIVRLSALCHDLGHLPFSHAAERAILGPLGHESWTLALIQSPLLQPIWAELTHLFPQHPVTSDLCKLAIGEEKLQEIDPRTPPFSPWQHILSQLICGDLFGADRIDYLLRDAHFIGISYGLIDHEQLIETLHIQPSSDNPNNLELAIAESGTEACEALLLARHFMLRRVYHHPTVKALSFHLSRFLVELYRSQRGLDSLDHYLAMTDSAVLFALQQAAKQSTHAGHEDARCLLRQQSHITALPLPPAIQESQLLALQHTLGLPKDALFWELPPMQRPLQGKQMADGALKLLIASSSGGWLYTPPQYHQLVHDQLAAMSS